MYHKAVRATNPGETADFESHEFTSEAGEGNAKIHLEDSEKDPLDN